MITNLNISRAENGYYLDYCEAVKAKKRVFMTWCDLCTWLCFQNKE